MHPRTPLFSIYTAVFSNGSLTDDHSFKYLVRRVSFPVPSPSTLLAFSLPLLHIFKIRKNLDLLICLNVLSALRCGTCLWLKKLEGGVGSLQAVVIYCWELPCGFWKLDLCLLQVFLASPSKEILVFFSGMSKSVLPAYVPV